MTFATPEILAAEATLDRVGWHEGHLASLAVETGANNDLTFHIPAGRMLWERVMLADGSAARLVTTIA